MRCDLADPEHLPRLCEGGNQSAQRGPAGSAMPWPMLVTLVVTAMISAVAGITAHTTARTTVGTANRGAHAPPPQVRERLRDLLSGILVTHTHIVPIHAT